MNTKEKNYLIASFLDFVPKEYEKRLGRELDYHKSWNSLMSVVNKIYNINAGLDFEDEQYLIYEEIFNIDYTCAEFMQNDLSSIYERCVEFITWYNKNK